MRRLLSSGIALARDRRGMSVVELGILAPLLSVLLVGVADLGHGLSERFTLQQAVNRSLEMLQARPVQTKPLVEMDYTFLRQEAATAADVPIGQVTLNQWLECDGDKQDDFTDHCEADEDVARYLELEVTKDFTGDFVVGTVPMVASAAMRIQ